jgi:chemotaxis protein MotB
MAKLPNKISIEGHTDSKPYQGSENYTNWELSADRANAARRLMQENGVRTDQIAEIRGYADQRLRSPSNPEDPSNRRVSLIVHYLESQLPDSPSTQPTSTNAEHADASHDKPDAAKN